ncbi:MAG: DUF3846 domain-containing protein [Oscillospiraceae bacterium]|jgi:hypothetical protein|nr:DUF3846 domain-containing protein [Oscillospiraceae bacterium]
MKVVLAEPGKKAVIAEIGEDLRSMQRAVGGLIQTVYPWQDSAALICNDEGKLMGLPFNRALRGEDGQIYDTVAGTFFVCGLTEENFCRLTEQQAEKYLSEFLEPEMLVRTNRGLVAIKCSELPPKSPRKEEMER